MPETTRMQNPATGEEYDIPGDMVAKATADGLQPKLSVGRQVAEFARGLDESISNHPVVNYNPLTWLEHGAIKAVAGIGGAKTREEIAEAEKNNPPTTVTMVGPDGGTYAMPKDVAAKAEKDGFKQVDALDAGPRGAGKAYLENVGNEFFAGVPAMAMSKQEKAEKAALDAAQPTASTVGGTVGFISSMLIDGPAALAGKAGDAAVQGATRAGVTGKVAQAAIREGARGAAFAAPRAAGELVFNGDPAAAGEVLLAGIGAGVLIGGGGVLASKVTRLGTEAAKRGIAAGLEKAEEAGVTHEELLAAGLKSAGKKAATAVGTGIGAAVGHPFMGYLAGKAAHAGVERGAEALAADPRVIKVAQQIASRVGQGLEELPEIVERIGSAGATRVASGLGSRAIAELTGTDSRTSKQKQFQQLQEAVSEAATSADQRVRAVSRLSDGLSAFHPDSVQSFQLASQAAYDHLHSVFPKDPHGQQPFASRAPWMPSDLELSRLGRRLDAWIDPIGTVNRELLHGTLTKEHVETIDAVYPKIAQEMRTRVMKLAMDPKAPQLGRAQLAQLEVLMKSSLNKRTEPPAVATYQGLYASDKDKEAAGKKTKLGDLPDAQTDVQRIANKAG